MTEDGQSGDNYHVLLPMVCDKSRKQELRKRRSKKTILRVRNT